MKRVLPALLIVSAVLCGCNKDIISYTEDPVDTSASANKDPDEALGEKDSIDDVAFDRTITVTWTESGASVEGDDTGIVKVSGTFVTTDNSNSQDIIRYRLGGTCSNGCFKLYSARKQAIVMQGLNLTNKSGAAINNQSRKRTFVVLEGENRLADGPTYSGTPSTEDEKAAFFSEGQLVFSGSGSLTVTATGKAGITSDDYLRFMGPQSVSATSTAGHAFRGKDAIMIDDGIIKASASADGKKGLTSDGAVTINGGTIDIKVSGGTLTEQVTTNGSTTTEYTGSAGIKADSTFVMTGGVLTVTNSGQGGKGITGDQKAFFEGGTVKVTVTGSNLSSTKAPGGGPGWPGGGPGGPGGSSNNLKSAKGIKFDGDVVVSGGTIEVSASSHEAFETKGTLKVTGGTLYGYSTADDAINSAGDMTLSGGFVSGWSPGNDGIDANGNLYVDGACVYAVSTKGSPEVAFDANTEGGYKLYVKSGTLIAVGGLESGCVITGSAYSASNWSRNAWHTLYDNSSNAIISFMTPASGSSLVVYSGGKSVTLKSGTAVENGTTIWGGNGATGGNVSGGSSVNLSSYSSSSRR
ncbi:MAG: carbohydrate-binding domain-containing protein [Bacteroidales bacterium]|nr:carbohydrate-binding domain-containing protein [Bacteroidales bacterium]